MQSNDELLGVVDQGDRLPVGCLAEFAGDDLFGVGPVVVRVVLSELCGWVGRAEGKVNFVFVSSWPA